MIVGDSQLVGTRRRLDEDGLNLRHGRHVEAGQGRCCKQANAVIGLATFIDVQSIAHVAAAIDGKQSEDRVDQRMGCFALDRDRIGVFAGCNVGVTGYCLDQNRVTSFAAHQIRRALVGGLNCERVVACAEPDIEYLKVTIDNTARQSPAAYDCVAAHAEPGQVVLGQGTFVICRAVAMVDVHGVDLVFLGHASVQVDRPVKVLVTGYRLVKLTGLDDRDVADGCNIDRCREARTLAVDDYQAVTIGHGREGHDSVSIDVVLQLSCHIGQGFTFCHGVRMGRRKGAVIEYDSPDLAFNRWLHRIIEGDDCRFHRVVGDPDILELKFLAETVDDQDSATLYQCCELIPGVRIDICGQSSDHVIGCIAREHGVAMLSGNLVYEQDNSPDLVFLRHSADQCISRSRGYGRRDKAAVRLIVDTVNGCKFIPDPVDYHKALSLSPGSEICRRY